MRILWFEISVPARYKDVKAPIAGWQDSLEEIVLNGSNVELAIAFEGAVGMKNKTIDKISYYPLCPSYSFLEKRRAKYDYFANAYKIIPLALNVIETVKPDVIHIFGSEWCFGLVAKHTKVPVVIHLQGCIASYNNALYPPMYSFSDLICRAGFNLRKQYNLYKDWHKAHTRQVMEADIFKYVSNYMGRTEWDKNLVNLFHPGANYYYCSEALRPAFIASAKDWQPTNNKQIRLITTGCSSFWKGMDTVLRTAHILKERGVSFEWIVVGNMGWIKKVIEYKENLKFEEVNIQILGFIDANKLIELLLSADMYIHTAYIDNSPNSICEAQYLGLPIIATYVGGIPSLLENGKEGLLLPANAPYTMAANIIKLSTDVNRQLEFSKATKEKARKRHNPQNILWDLMACYQDILK